MKVIIRSPAMPLLVLGIILDVPVSRARPKAGHDPQRKRDEEQRADTLQVPGAVGKQAERSVGRSTKDSHFR